MLRRRSWTAILGVVLLATAVQPATEVRAATDLLPDLGMARLKDFRVELTRDGRRLLRFTTIIVNVGTGPFEVLGQRSDATVTEMATQQRIFADDGSSRDRPTDAVLYFAGDGHSHWHVRDLEHYTLQHVTAPGIVGTGAKHGFCFYDNTRYRLTLPGAPSSAVYTHCGRSTDLSLRMGLSVGWGDTYPYNLRDQYIDITNLPSGRYRLSATADPASETYPTGWFTEINESNNTTWVVLELSGRRSVRAREYGPAA